MSSIPKIDKSKYNKSAPYEWVDSQWEKFITEQKELKAQIKQLQSDLGFCTKNYQEQRKQFEELVLKVPSIYLTDSAKFSGETHPDAKHTSISIEGNERSDEWRIEQFNRNRGVEDQVKTIEEMEDRVKELFEEPKYIYESPDKGETVYRREFGDYDTPRVQIDKDGNPLPLQTELF